MHLPSSLLSFLLLALPISPSLVQAAASPSSPSSSSVLKSPTRPRSGMAKNILESKPETRGYCSPSGPIENTLCEYETLERVNTDLYTNLHDLVKTPFFRYFKVDLFKECPFWHENTFCMNRDCSVETAEEGDVPEKWKTSSLGAIAYSSSAEATANQPHPSCYYRDQDFCELDDESQNEGQYVDLSLNPERFTGYAGLSAARVWKSIYEENCFGLSELSVSDSSEGSSLSSSSQGHLAPGAIIPGLNGGGLTGGGALSEGTEMRDGGDEECVEKRVYYRIVSGLHASISTHICSEFLDQETGLWAPDLQCFIYRIASHPDRLQNMYFNLVLLLRAVSRAGPYLEAYDVSTGDLQLDEQTRTGLRKVVEAAKGGEEGRGEVFDEGGMFKGEDALLIKQEFKDRFRNVSRIMDCVGCDKCRLWGKLQVSGVGTALKILFELDEKALDPKINPGLLSRSEIVSLFNTLHRFSESLHAVEEFRKLYAEAKKAGGGEKKKTKPSSRPSSKEGSDQPPRLPLSATLSRLLEKVQEVVEVCRTSVWECLEVWLESGWFGALWDWEKEDSPDDGWTKGSKGKQEL
ncbi:endoplasmic reticulum Oxidoreductin 1-domain-containing protein [Mrakia frigida]|uniref:ER oxidoreductin n=1 Tax=Mrakia frigida TaxID=29902 RepID=UPI003FCC08CF